MSTADTDPLTERIAMAWNESTPEQWAEMDRHRHGPGLKALTLQGAARVLPVVAEEVRKAKAEALREMQEHHEREAGKAETITARGIHLTIADGARERATEYETGDQ